MLAMAVSPRFDPNTVAALAPDRWRNRALTDTDEPGSTDEDCEIAAAALEEKVMTPGICSMEKTANCRLPTRLFTTMRKSGWMTFAQMIQKSSNIGAAKVGMALGNGGCTTI